jgi:outer membrane receptor protein involved in Fe transport
MRDSKTPSRKLRLAVLFAIGTSATAVAQEPLEEIFVTGSRIARPDFESASPIVSITQESFERTSATSVDVVMNRLPQFVPDVTSTSNNPSNGGQGNLQLRGLSPWRTLVLMDGRRLIPANGTGVVDVNIIPRALIESVEVITGGASAVYGSDAIAGVVNFKLLQEFDGLQFDGGWGLTDKGDGDEYYGDVTGGFEFADGRGQVFGHVGYSERKALTYDDRDYTKYSLEYLGPGQGLLGPESAFFASGSFTIEAGRPTALRSSQAAFRSLFESYGYPAGSVPYQTTFGINQDGTPFTMGNGVPGSVANYRGYRDPVQYNDFFYTYNFAPYNYLQLPLERVSAFAGGSFELGAGHEIYGRALYSDYSADMALAPAPTTFLFMPVTNPYVSPDLKFLLDSRGNPAADMRFAKRFAELGPRVASNSYDVYQVTVGVDGPLFDSWDYDVYAQYGENDQRERQAGNALRSRIQELTYAPDGGRSICGEFNILIIGGMSRECVDYIAASGTNRSGYEQTVFEASVTGPAFELPAGDVHLAFGVMHKRDEYFYKADPIASAILPDGAPDIVGFNASDDIDGSDSNTDLYVEALVPILAGLPGVEQLELVLGYRYSDYESAGGADSWKAELLYAPIDSLRFRSSLQRAVRAPSVFELYQPRLPTGIGTNPAFGGVLDPCEATSPERNGPNASQVEALCLAQGVPPDLMPDFTDQDLLHEGVVGGNPDLDPESGDTFTIGFVWTSRASHPLLSGMQFSLDWYRIEMEDAIQEIWPDEYIPLCFDARTNPRFEASNRWCSYFGRNDVSGEIEDFEITNTNIEGFELSGIDLQFDWTLAAGPGYVGLNALVSWMDSFKRLPPPGLPESELVGTVGDRLGGSLPEWKTNLNLRYDWQSLGLGLQWRYIDSMQDAGVPEFEIPSRDYFDLYASYVISEGVLGGLTLRGGIENLTNENPPLLASPVQGNTDPSQYDMLGRRYYVNLSYRF